MTLKRVPFTRDLPAQGCNLAHDRSGVKKEIVRENIVRE